ncbi:hypothetical protein BGZ76_003347 [Entomortierella beljakovae]|nr:hypothetical protein BGZ76_003347 [Entomortierella beljakovae]
MSNPGTSGGAGAGGSGFQPGLYPQPIGTFSKTGAGMSIASGSGTPQSSAMSSLPLTSTPAGTAPRKQLAAAAAAGAAASANKSGRAKAPYKKATTGNSGRRGGRGGGGGGRGGGRASSAVGDGDDDYGGGGGGGGKDSDDDNEDEPEVSIEEQFILRLPAGEMCDKFREKVIAREVDETTKLKFVDARRGTFTFEGMEFSTKLVDLPTVIEAQKTLNGKQMYKIADISQMLIVDPVPTSEKVPEVKTEPSVPELSTSITNNGSSASAPSSLPPLKLSDYIWADGLTNPLKNVRKRRFRKRISKVAVEGVENEVERLLKEDSAAEEVRFEIREQIDGMDRFDSDDGATPAPEGVQSDMDMDGEMMDMDEEDDEEEEDEDDFLAELERHIGGGENTSDDDGEGANTKSGASISIGSSTNNNNKAGLLDIKSGATLASAGSLASSAAIASGGSKPINKGKGKVDDDDDGEDDEDDDEEEDEDDDDDDSGSEEEDDDDGDEGDKESAQMEKLLKDEIKELHGKVKDSEEKLQSAPNDILKRRFGSILDNLRKELELKTMQLEEAKEKSKSKGK